MKSKVLALGLAGFLVLVHPPLLALDGGGFQTIQDENQGEAPEEYPDEGDEAPEYDNSEDNENEYGSGEDDGYEEYSPGSGEES